jgi:serine/threonine protein phosphatase PrpC
MKVFAYSAQGRRDYQEDSLLADINRQIYVVADGVGGHPHGDWASQHIVETIVENYDISDSINTALERLRQNIYSANSKCEMFRDSRASTATAIRIIGNTIAYSHAGDTRFYLMLGNEKLNQITTDHGYGRHLHNAVGFLYHQESGIVEFDDTSMILLTSDGIHDILADSEMLTIINRALEIDNDPAQALVEMAIERNSQDNCTAIILFTGG